MDGNKITLFHNTTNSNAIKIVREGIIGGLRLSAYGKGSEGEGAGICCSTERGYGYGGATVTFEVNNNDSALMKQNDTEYIIYRNIKPEEIIDIDLMISDIPSVSRNGNSGTLESDIPQAIKQWGKDKLIKVLGKYPKHFIAPYNEEQLLHLIETGEKYCKGNIKMNEGKEMKKDEEIQAEVTKQELLDKVDNLAKKYGRAEAGSMLAYYFDESWYQEDRRYSKIEYVKNVINNCYKDSYREDDLFHQGINNEIIRHINNSERLLNKKYTNLKTESKKLEEVSRNELLAKSKQQTITRYNKSAGYKGFSIVDIDTTSVLSTDSLRVTCRVGDYFDTVEVEDILYWVQFYAEQNETNQINSKVVTQAIMDAIDAMTIKVDCNCGDFKYRFAYLATKMGYKYGKPENRPAKITNPNDYGAMCKHLISMLSNKKWLQQVTGTFMDFLEKRIEEVNRYLRVRKGEELTLPNELARQNAKKGFYSKLFKDIDEEENDNDNVHNNDVRTNGGSDNTSDTETTSDTNMDGVHDNKNNVEDKVDTDDSNNISNSDIESEDESNE